MKKLNADVIVAIILTVFFFMILAVYLAVYDGTKFVKYQETKFYSIVENNNNDDSNDSFVLYTKKGKTFITSFRSFIGLDENLEPIKLPFCDSTVFERNPKLQTYGIKRLALCSYLFSAEPKPCDGFCNTDYEIPLQTVFKKAINIPAYNKETILGEDIE